ncbi:iron-containing alcohol dehydrogenase [Streptomyces sp. NPDC017086]|uniref:iron-containing alcohol dehydrogenase n=1 Tax=Streptomyces sp. NPDC017086 TaxID=3364976 RepID=UPI0037B137E1
MTTRALSLLRETGTDCLVSVGGGSTTGLSKALALRTSLPQVAVPTTYGGSGVTPVLRETREERKVPQSSASVLPETVVYNIDLASPCPCPCPLRTRVA